MKRKAFTVIEVLVVVAVIGAVAAFLFPSLTHKDIRNANNSQKATQQLETAITDQSGEAAGSVVAIGRMNSLAPNSPQKLAIAAEIPVVLGKLSKPDPVAEATAWKRMALVAEGRADLAEALYASEANHSRDLQQQVDEGKAYRQATDLKLSEAAFYKLGAERTKMALGALAGLALAAFVYTRIYGIHTNAMGNIVADIRAGVNPIQAIDTHLGPRLHARVQKAARLATPSV